MDTEDALDRSFDTAIEYSMVAIIATEKTRLRHASE
jgi:hypothetical protein